MSSRISNPSGTHSLPQAAAPRERVPLNEVMQQTLQECQAGGRHPNMIVRCENLPQVEGSKAAICEGFRELIRTIVHHPPPGSKLFLYIDCEEEHKDVDPELTQGYKRFRLQFHTNVVTTEDWLNANAAPLELCAERFGSFGGAFTVNKIKNTGCLFSLSLTGKL